MKQQTVFNKKDITNLVIDKVMRKGETVSIKSLLIEVKIKDEDSWKEISDLSISVSSTHE